MDTDMLRPDEFRHFVARSLQGFLEDWAAHRSVDPEVFTEALPALDWLELFSEFTAAEIVNAPEATMATRRRASGPRRDQRRRPGEAGRRPSNRGAGRT